jgi:hypothetical protein
MAARFSELTIDSTDPATLARWWSEVLGYNVTDDADDAVEIAGPQGSGPTIVFARVPEKKMIKNRLHIDLSPTDRNQGEELERLLGLGARRADVGQGDDVTWVVLTDPEGNEFCLLRTRREAWGQDAAVQ